MDTCHVVAAGHEDLWFASVISHGRRSNDGRFHGQVSRCSRTRSKAVEHARGWVATKMGLSDIFDVRLKAVLIFQDLPAFEVLCECGCEVGSGQCSEDREG